MTVIRQDYQVEYEIGPIYPASFPFEFGAIAIDHIKVYEINPALPENDDRYRVLIETAEIYPNEAGIEFGGYVVTPYPLDVGRILLIRRETPRIQETTFQTQREMDPRTVEFALDYLTYLVQEGVAPDGLEQFNDTLDALSGSIASLETSKADKAALDSAASSLRESIEALWQDVDDKLPDDHIDRAVNPDPHPQYVLKTGLPIASESLVGGVKIDGVVFGVAADGTLLLLGGGGGGGTGEGGTTDHALLINRNVAGQHDSVAVTHTIETDKVVLNVLLDSMLADINAGSLDIGTLQAAVASKADRTVATPTADGLMSAQDKINLDSLQAVSGNYLPTTGGTISGALAVTGNTTVGGTLTVAGTNIVSTLSGLSTRMVTAETSIASHAASINSLGDMAKVADAAKDGKTYGRNNGAWTEIASSSGSGGGAMAGEIRMLPWRASALPEGWYLCNGDQFLLTSAQGVVLAGLSAQMKSDWSITTSGNYIALPNFFSGTSGYFIRAVNSYNRYPGNKQSFAMQNITAGFGQGDTMGVAWHSTSNGASTLTGAFYSTATKKYGSSAYGYGANTCGDLYFDASRVATTDSETRPMNVGMTPAIYLGV